MSGGGGEILARYPSDSCFTKCYISIQELVYDLMHSCIIAINYYSLLSVERKLKGAPEL